MGEFNGCPINPFFVENLRTLRAKIDSDLAPLEFQTFAVFENNETLSKEEGLFLYKTTKMCNI